MPQACSLCRRPGHNRTTCVSRQTKQVADLKGELCRLWQEYSREKAILVDVSTKDLKLRAAAENAILVDHVSTKDLKLRLHQPHEDDNDDEWELISSQICAEVASVDSK